MGPAYCEVNYSDSWIPTLDWGSMMTMQPWVDSAVQEEGRLEAGLPAGWWCQRTWHQHGLRLRKKPGFRVLRLAVFCAKIMHFLKDRCLVGLWNWCLFSAAVYHCNFSCDWMPCLYPMNWDAASLFVCLSLSDHNRPHCLWFISISHYSWDVYSQCYPSPTHAQRHTGPYRDSTVGAKGFKVPACALWLSSTVCFFYCKASPLFSCGTGCHPSQKNIIKHCEMFFQFLFI